MHTENVKLDDCVLRFAVRMQHKLNKNKHKACIKLNPTGVGRSWMSCDYQWLLYRLRQETLELEEALYSQPENITDEAADVANFAMMIFDKMSCIEQCPALRSLLKKESDHETSL